MVNTQSTDNLQYAAVGSGLGKMIHDSLRVILGEHTAPSAPTAGTGTGTGTANTGIAGTATTAAAAAAPARPNDRHGIAMVRQ